MRLSRFASVAALALALLLSPVVSADTPAKDDKPPVVKKWTMDDFLLSENVGAVEVSPDGKAVVWSKSVMDTEKQGRTSNLILTRFTGPKEKTDTVLTRGKSGAFAPKWSPDGKRIAFLTGRPDPDADDKSEGAQVWLFDLDAGGEPHPITSGKRGVFGYEWQDDKTLLLTLQEEAAQYERKTDDDKDTTIVVEDEIHEPPVRLYRFDIDDEKLTRLTDNTDRIGGIWLSPDSTKFVAVHEESLRYGYDEEIPPVWYLYDRATMQKTRLFPERKYALGGVEWTKDSKAFYVTNRKTNHPYFHEATINNLYYYEVASGKATEVNLDWERGLYAGVKPLKDGFLTLLVDGARTKPARYTLLPGATPTWKREWLTGEHAEHIFDFALGDDNDTTVLYNYSTASLPDAWYRATLNGATLTEPSSAIDTNGGIRKTRSFAKTELVHWTGALKEDVEGILYYPQDYQPGKKYPLVVMIHGGPAYADPYAWDESFFYPANLYCQKGAFVLKPNYHGSTNYGLKFVESIAGGSQYYDLPVEDIEKGVDALVGKGMVDKDKLGVLGWSNGAILTLALIAHSDRFKAAASGAGGFEWTSDWAECAFGHSFDMYYFGNSPLKDPELYRKISPFYKFDKVKTPLIIFHGTADRSVPTAHGWMQYRALQEHTKTPVRLLLFPGEGHGPQRLTHQRRKIVEESAWFDKYLFGTLKEKNEAVKDGSPLARLLKSQGIQKDKAGRYGVDSPYGLLPEVVKRDDLEIGRFEVTRAQYVAFDTSYPVAPGTENYPATGISYEQAQAYCKWLSEKTASVFRLPTDKEMTGKLGESASENTLDYWAGYAVNPDDATRLLPEIKSLAPNGAVPSLLKPVGSFAGIGNDEEEYLFDLKGNAAEWVTNKDGKGEAKGGCAILPVDKRTKDKTPTLNYIGFRVVREIR